MRDGDRGGGANKLREHARPAKHGCELVDAGDDGGVLAADGAAEHAVVDALEGDAEGRALADHGARVAEDGHRRGIEHGAVEVDDAAAGRCREPQR